MIQRVLFSLVVLLFSFNCYASTLDSLQAELNKSSGIKKAEVLNNISYNYLHKDQKQSVVYAKKALKIGLTKNDSPTIAQSYYRIGIAYDLMSDFTEALVYYNKSLKVNQIIKNSEKVSGCLNSIGGVYYYLGNYKNALTYYLKALKIREELFDKSKRSDDERLIAQSQNNIAMIYKVQGDYQKAIEYYQLSLKVKRKNKDKMGMLTSLMNLGTVYLDKKDLIASRKMLEEALQLAKAENSAEDIGSILVNIGLTYKTPKELYLALSYFNQAKEIYDTLQSPFVLSCIHVNMSAVYIDLKAYDKAIFYASKALKVSKETKSLRVEQEAEKALISCYESQKDYKKALQHQNNLMAINDSLLNKDKNRALIELSTKYETDKKQQQIELLNIKSELQQTKITKEKSKIITLSTLLGFVIALSLIIIFAIRHKKKINEQKALMKLQMHINQIDLLQNQLAQKVKNNTPLVNIKLKETDINQYLMDPLSSREIEVLNLISEGKTNKEISEALFLSVNTIKSHIMRIYEKLDVQNRTQAAVKANLLIAS